MVERTKVRQLNQLVMAAQAAEFLGDSLSYVHRATGAIVGLRQMETKNHIASLLGLRRGMTAEVMSLRRGYAMGDQKLLRAPPGRMFGRVQPEMDLSQGQDSALRSQGWACCWLFSEQGLQKWLTRQRV
jgi:hypothetical protein